MDQESERGVGRMNQRIAESRRMRISTRALSSGSPPRALSRRRGSLVPAAVMRILRQSAAIHKRSSPRHGRSSNDIFTGCLVHEADRGNHANLAGIVIVAVDNTPGTGEVIDVAVSENHGNHCNFYVD